MLTPCKVFFNAAETFVSTAEKHLETSFKVLMCDKNRRAVNTPQS